MNNEKQKNIPTPYQEKLLKDMQEIFLKELENISKRENFDITCILHLSTRKDKHTSMGAMGFLFRGDSKLILGSIADCRERLEDFHFKHLKEKLERIFNKLQTNED